jgi:hypothetical protein
MPQTTGGVALACGQLEISLDGACASYTDISGESQSVEGTEQTRISGEAYTFDGDTAIIRGGKREPMELVFVIVYTETDDEAYEIIRESFETAGCGVNVCVRWSPRGGNAGDERITSGTGILVSFTYPTMDATAGGPILAGFTVKVPGTSTTIVAS